MLRACASLQLAVGLITVCCIVLAWATIMESRLGTPAVRFGIYGTGWFAALNVALAINVLSAALIRLPWKRRVAGFLITHAGILVLLFGCMLTRWKGIDAQLPIVETDTVDRAFKDTQHFEMTIYPAATAGAKPETIRVPFRPGPFKPDADGFITDWLACGPFPNVQIETDQGLGFHGHRTDMLEAYGGEVNITPTYGVEYKVTFPDKGPWLAGEDVVSWQDLHSTESMVSLKNIALPSRGIIAGPPSSVCAYVACTIEPSEPRRVAAVKLAVGSDDGYKLWLNGKLVGQLEDCRAAAADQEVYPVQLVKGENRILLKVFQSVGGWAFCVRFLDSQGKPIKDLSITLAGKDTK